MNLITHCDTKDSEAVIATFTGRWDALQRPDYAANTTEAAWTSANDRL
jgi:hypothetical protein